MTPTEALAALNLTVKAVFVPFSLSRNNGKTKGRELWKSLNWTVTLMRGEREVLTTEYSAGVGHCPGDKVKMPQTWDQSPRNWKPAITDWEIENGFEATWMRFTGFAAARRPATEAEIAEGKRDRVRKAILPQPENVVHSLLMDMVDEPFEDWALNLGYDPDSIKAKAIYDYCVEHTMRMRQWLGNEGIETLREAFEDY